MQHDGPAPDRLSSALGRGALLEFEFSLRFELGECDALLELAMERFEATGDANTLLGASISAVLELQVARNAASAEEALYGAAGAVQRAFPGAKLLAITPAPDTPSA